MSRLSDWEDTESYHTMPGRARGEQRNRFSRRFNSQVSHGRTIFSDIVRIRVTNEPSGHANIGPAIPCAKPPLRQLCKRVWRRGSVALTHYSPIYCVADPPPPAPTFFIGRKLAHPFRLPPKSVTTRKAPLSPVLRGERSGVRGFFGNLDPSPPTPLPRRAGEAAVSANSRYTLTLTPNPSPLKGGRGASRKASKSASAGSYFPSLGRAWKEFGNSAVSMVAPPLRVRS
jgi:hypothetical protein